MPLSRNMVGDEPDSFYGFRRCCEAVRDGVPIEQIARRYTKLEPVGGKAWFSGRCPLPDHEDRTPSFYIYPPGRWWCYGCGRAVRFHRDELDRWMDSRNRKERCLRRETCRRISRARIPKHHDGGRT